MYKITYAPNPETHACGNIIIITDENGREVAIGKNNQNDTFDYIKTVLEHDDKYKEFITKPYIYAKDIYDELNSFNREAVQKYLVQRYRDQCMFEYWNQPN